MTDLEDFLVKMRGLGIKLWVEGGKLKLRAPEGVLTAALTEAIKQRKAEILGLLQPDPDQTIPPLPVQDTYELSAAQRRLWVLTRFPEAAAAYNIPLHQILEGPLDRAALETAFSRLVERHESLRTTFVTAAGEPRQVVHPRFKVPLGFRDISDDGDPEGLAKRLGREDAAKPFDPETGPLLRACLLRLGQDRHVLLFTIFHIIADGVSLAVLARELGRLYEAVRTGGPDGLPELAFGYPAYAAWQNRLLTSGLMAPHRAYWHAVLAGELPVLALPADFPRPPLQGFRGRELSLTLPPERLEALNAFCRPRNASLFMVLHAVLKVLLFSYTGQEDIIVGCAVAGREHPGLADQVGFYLNTLALRSTVRGDMTFDEFFSETARQTREAFDHQVYPFDQLVDELNIPRDLRRFPLFDVMLVLQNQDEPGLGLDGIRSRPAFEHPETSKFDLTFTAKATPVGLILGIEYNTGLFEPASVQAMADSFAGLLEAAVASPGCPVGDLPAVTPAQRAALLALGRGPDLAVPECGLFELIEAQARRTPDRRAVADETADLSYATLIQAAETIAARLQRLGAGPGSRVGLMLERGAALPAAVLGILRTGAAYVPLDPGFPAERLAYAAADAGIGALLTQTSLSALWPPGLPVCRIDDPAPVDLPPAPVRADPAACAYILYTSGSTGRPKGVRIAHRSVVSFLLAMRHELGMTADARLLAVTTIGFDIAVLELLLPLTLGACTVICDRETAADGRALARRLAASGADWMQATPATWRLLLDAGWPGQPNLTALCGGEALPAGLAAALLPVTGALWNLYGPTETTVWSTCGRVEPGAPVTLGRPIANTRLYVLDGRGRLVPPGVAGELHIGGAGVALDYGGRPDLTADRFLAAPDADPDGGRVYRTGDRVRWSAAGRLHYLGRFDHQIKLRGYRIEPGEIEAVLSEHPGVGQAVLDLRDGDRLIAWYVATTAGREPAAAELRAHVRSRLPAYMVPAAFVPVPEFPLTANGKVDRAALPEPDSGSGLDRDVPYQPPATEWEHRIAGLWRDVLKVRRVGVNDNFFELGGHSLKAAAFTARLQSETGICLDLIDVFRQPTLAGLARLAGKRGTGALPPIAIATATATGGPGIRPATAEELEILERS